MTTLAGQEGATIYNLDGSTLISRGPAFEINRQLDVKGFLEFVAGAGDAGGPPHSNCSSQEIRARLDQTIELVRGQDSRRALELLKQMKSCF